MTTEFIELRDRLITQMKAAFGPDQRRIDHALKVLSYAQRILQDHAGDTLVVQAAAILHDIGIQRAEQKYNSSAARYQELEGPPIARKIMHKLAIDPETIEHVCLIVANHHSARKLDTPEFRIVWDADWIVNIPHVWPEKNAEDLRLSIAKTLRTPTGESLALALYCNESNP